MVPFAKMDFELTRSLSLLQDAKIAEQRVIPALLQPPGLDKCPLDNASKNVTTI